MLALKDVREPNSPFAGKRVVLWRDNGQMVRLVRNPLEPAATI
jgi:hypothetical protein